MSIIIQKQKDLKGEWFKLHQKWLSIFEDYNELDLLKKLRYISKILTGFGFKKFKAVNVLVGAE